MTRRTLLGALKCAFRELRRELDTILAIFAAGLAGDGVSRTRSEVAIERSLGSNAKMLVCEASVHGLTCALVPWPQLVASAAQRVRGRRTRRPGNITNKTRPSFPARATSAKPYPRDFCTRRYRN